MRLLCKFTQFHANYTQAKNTKYGRSGNRGKVELVLFKPVVIIKVFVHLQYAHIADARPFGVNVCVMPVGNQAHLGGGERNTVPLTVEVVAPLALDAPDEALRAPAVCDRLRLTPPTLMVPA